MLHTSSWVIGQPVALMPPLLELLLFAEAAVGAGVGSWRWRTRMPVPHERVHDDHMRQSPSLSHTFGHG